MVYLNNGVEQKQESSHCKSNNIAEVKGIASHLNRAKARGEGRAPEISFSFTLEKLKVDFPDTPVEISPSHLYWSFHA
jgi:hypothetical protein